MYPKNKIDIKISASDIAQTFLMFKQEHGKSPDPDDIVTIPLCLQDIGSLATIIKSYSLSHYDSQAFNSALTEILQKGFNHNGSFIYDMTMYNRYSRPFIKYNNKVPESTLQIGPGGSLGCEVLLCVSGTKRAYTLDAFPLMTFDLDGFINTAKEYFESMRWIDGLNGFNPSSLSVPDSRLIGKGHFQVGDSVIEHIHPRTFEETGFENDSIDFLFSHATLEHVTNPMKCIQETHRVLKKGGITAHCIDLRDHRDFDQPLGFLRESDGKWATMMKEYCSQDASGYMNRWRASEFKNAFENEGFELLEDVAEMKVNDEIIDTEIPLMDEKYRSFERDDLMTTTIFIVARKV